MDSLLRSPVGPRAAVAHQLQREHAGVRHGSLRAEPGAADPRSAHAGLHRPPQPADARPRRPLLVRAELAAGHRAGRNGVRPANVARLGHQRPVHQGDGLPVYRVHAAEHLGHRPAVRQLAAESVLGVRRARRLAQHERPDEPPDLLPPDQAEGPLAQPGLQHRPVHRPGGRPRRLRSGQPARVGHQVRHRRSVGEPAHAAIVQPVRGQRDAHHRVRHAGSEHAANPAAALQRDGFPRPDAGAPAAPPAPLALTGSQQLVRLPIRV